LGRRFLDDALSSPARTKRLLRRLSSNISQVFVLFYSFASKLSIKTDEQQALLETAAPEHLSTLPVSLCRKLYEKKTFSAEVCNEETPTLQT
jgi:hypothetical protein